MNRFQIHAMPTNQVRAYQRGGKDANGMVPEHHVSDGVGNPCRHCLQTIEKGADMLVLAYRPFAKPQPYAEIGPIFLHGSECQRYDLPYAFPEIFNRHDAVLVRGYGNDDRIQYQAAQIVPVNELNTQCTNMLSNPNVAYLHVRSKQYNCYQCRIERA